VAAREIADLNDPGLGLTLAVVASSKPPLLLLDGDLHVIAASLSFLREFNIDRATVTGARLFDLGAGEWDTPQLRSLLTATAAGHADVDAYELDLGTAGQPVKRLMLHAERLDYQDAAPPRLLLAVTDLTEAQATQRRTDDMRRENALLLTELRHRVANSLQIIASVLLQDARRTQSEEARGHLHSAHHRVMSVATLERQLSVSDGDEVSLRTYLISLCDSIAASMIHDPSLISIDVIAEDVSVDSTVSVSLGLIVTELVINALKYAFPDRGPGKIQVTYATDGEGWSLTVRDNGVGMPKDATKAVPGLGTSIVRALTTQLRAKVSVSSGSPGAVVSIVHGSSTGAAGQEADLAPLAV
jgi:two-component sensor histidine kinase